MAYFLLAGRPPFNEDKPLKVLLAHAHQPPLPLRRLDDRLPVDLEEIVLRCLAKEPAERFADVASLAAALRACQAAGEWDHHSAARWWQDNGSQPAQREPAMV